MTFAKYEFMQPDGSEISLRALAVEQNVTYSTVRKWALEGRAGVKLRVCRLPLGIGSSATEYHAWIRRLTEAMEECDVD